jgi:hypothetical protein
MKRSCSLLAQSFATGFSAVNFVSGSKMTIKSKAIRADPSLYLPLNHHPNRNLHPSLSRLWAFAWPSIISHAELQNTIFAWRQAQAER